MGVGIGCGVAVGAGVVVGKGVGKTMGVAVGMLDRISCIRRSISSSEGPQASTIRVSAISPASLSSLQDI